MSRRKIYRKEDKQISFFTSSEIHEAIKFEAKEKNTSIKEYLINLHHNATNKTSSENLITDMHTMMKNLFDSQAFLVMPQPQTHTQTGQHVQQNINLNRESHNNNHDKVRRSISNSSDHSDEQTSRPTPSITFSPQLDEYLSNITRSSTFETMKRIILSLIKLKEATHYQINQEIGHTTHNQPRALKRAVEDKIVLVDEPENPKEPYYYRLNPVYLS